MVSLVPTGGNEKRHPTTTSKPDESKFLSTTIPPTIPGLSFPAPFKLLSWHENVEMLVRGENLRKSKFAQRYAFLPLVLLFLFLSFFYLKCQTDHLSLFYRSQSSTADNVRLNALFDTLVAGSSRTRTAPVTPPAGPTRWQWQWQWRRQFGYEPTLLGERQRSHATQSVQGVVHSKLEAFGIGLGREASLSTGSGLGGACGQELEDIFGGAGSRRVGPGTISFTGVRFLSFFRTLFFKYQ